MSYSEANKLALQVMQQAVEQSGGDDIQLTKALAKAMQDPRVAAAFKAVGYDDLLEEQNSTKH